MKPKLIVEPDASRLVEKAGAALIEAARNSILARGRFSLALAGGSTPKALYAYLASPERSHQVPWNYVHVFFGDERAVSPEDVFSNYRMAREALLNHVPIPAENVHRMQAEREDLEVAAEEYAADLDKFAPLDLVLLGMGDDGHTASLFPNSPVLHETKKSCAATPVASLQPQVRRMTLTFPAINSAERVWILITGAGKTARLKQVEIAQRSGQLDIEAMPVLGVAPGKEYIWWLDEAAVPSES